MLGSPHHLSPAEFKAEWENVFGTIDHLYETIPDMHRGEWADFLGKFIADTLCTVGLTKAPSVIRNINIPIKPHMQRLANRINGYIDLAHPEMVTAEGIRLTVTEPPVSKSLFERMGDKIWGTRQAGNVGATVQEINQSSIAILKNGYYEVNGFKFSEYYYNKLWNNGRGAPSLIAKEVLDHAKSFVADNKMPGFYRYEYNGWELVYNPATKEIWHLQLFKNK